MSPTPPLAALSFPIKCFSSSHPTLFSPSVGSAASIVLAQSVTAFSKFNPPSMAVSVLQSFSVVVSCEGVVVLVLGDWKLNTAVDGDRPSLREHVLPLWVCT